MDRPAERRFVGRHAELQTLQQALQRAVAGQPGIVLLAGEPGIGKTRTAQEMIAFAAQHEVLALWGRCPEEAGAPPYWPWVQLMRRWIALQDEAELARVFACGGAAGLAGPALRSAPAAGGTGVGPRRPGAGPLPALRCGGRLLAARGRAPAAAAGAGRPAPRRRALAAAAGIRHGRSRPQPPAGAGHLPRRRTDAPASAEPTACCSCIATRRCSGCCSAASPPPRRPSSSPPPGWPRPSWAC